MWAPPAAANDVAIYKVSSRLASTHVRCAATLKPEDLCNVVTTSRVKSRVVPPAPQVTEINPGAKGVKT